MENYETLGVIGEGTYGVVMKARHRETGQLVAIKKFKESDEDEQVRKTSLREVRVLKQLRHENVITLLEVFRRKGKLYLVFEYVEKTILEVLEKRPNGLDEMDVRRYMYQLLRGVEYCHSHNIIHRDIKPENILISKSGALKLCDFGFARTMSVGGKYTDYVATRWYRCPELLVGDVEYGKGVDIWAVGCIFAEISNGMPLFPGESDLDQLSHILRCIGKLTSRQVSIFKKNQLFQGVELPVPRGELETLDQRFPIAPKPWINFLKSCLKNDADGRETASGLLNSPYFTERGFKQDFETELKMIFERENKQLSAFSSNRRSDAAATAPSGEAGGLTLPSANAGNNNVMPPGTAPGSLPPRTPGSLPTSLGMSATSGAPSVGALWSQYLATTSTELPDLSMGSRGQALPQQHPGLFAPSLAQGAGGKGLYYQMPPSTPQGSVRNSFGMESGSMAPPLPAHHQYPHQTTGGSLPPSSGAPNFMMMTGTSVLPAPEKKTPAQGGSGSGLSFPNLHNNGPAPTSQTAMANQALGLSFKKKPAKRNVLSTLSISSLGPSGGSLPYSYGQ